MTLNAPFVRNGEELNLSLVLHSYVIDGKQNDTLALGQWLSSGSSDVQTNRVGSTADRHCSVL